MKKGEICLIEFISFKGHEQTGLRPAIVMSDKIANIVLVIPLTTKQEALKYPYTLKIKQSNKNKLNSDSIALIFQLRAVDFRKIKNKVGEIEKDLLKNIDTQIKQLLNLK